MVVGQFEGAGAIRIAPLACFTKNVFVLAIADNERALAVALGLTNSNPSRVGSMMMNEMVPSSFLREAALPSVEHKKRVSTLVLDSDGPQRTAGIVIGEL
jgi:hypothetical protein